MDYLYEEDKDNKEASPQMNTWNIPVTAVICDEVHIRAPTLKEAIKIAKEKKVFSHNLSVYEYRIDADEEYISKYFNKKNDML